jgi:hypothetical protein
MFFPFILVICIGFASQNYYIGPTPAQKLYSQNGDLNLSPEHVNDLSGD